jgi:hypothetical protein
VTGEHPDRPDSLDDVFVALADDQRRRVLSHLDGADDARVPVADLVAVAGQTEPADGETAAPEALRRNLRILAELGFVEYETGADTVVRAPAFDYVVPFLSTAERSPDAVD